MNEKELLKEALDLLKSYRDELERMVKRDKFYAKFIRYDELAGLEKDYAELQENCEKEGKDG